MAYEKEVHVQGDINNIWDRLTSTLAYNNYKIKNTVSQRQIIAEKGSKVVSGLVGGTKGGYRSVEIGINPTDQDTIVKFSFKFSALGLGSAYKGTISEIDKMIQDFEYDLSKEQKIQPASKESSESKIKCPHCDAPVQKGWKACPGCGNKLSLTCPHCKAEIQAGWKACPACGEKLG